MIGVLNLQGDVREHVAALREVGVGAGSAPGAAGSGSGSDGIRLVKRPADLEGLAGLVLPGGESTTLSMLLTSTGLFEPLATMIHDGLPVLGTCAGLVLLATEVLDGRPDQRSFGALAAVVRRNGFGRQSQSFEAVVAFGEGPPLPTVFIRAPLVVGVGDEVEVLATLSRGGSGEGESADREAGPGEARAISSSPVLVRQGSVLASCFHPELTPDRRVHALFAAMCGAGTGADADADADPDAGTGADADHGSEAGVSESSC